MATLRCEECGYKLYEDEDDCPKCGALVDDRPRSKKKSRDDEDEDDDRPKKKARRDDDDADDRPKKKATQAEFEILDDDDEPAPKKKPTPPKKPARADFEIVVDDEDEEDEKPAPKPVKKPAPPAKPVVKKAPPPPLPSANDEPESSPVKKAPPVNDADDEDREEPTPKPAKNVTQDDDYDDVRPAKKAKGKGQYDGLVVPRWTGIFTCTLLFGLFGPILLGVGLWLVHDSGIDKMRSERADVFGLQLDSSKYREHNSTKLVLGKVLAIAGGSMWAMAGFLFYLWLWRAWKLVPKEYGGMHPFVALLLLWVPLLQMVGVFLVIPGLSKAFKRMLEDLEPRRTPKTGVGVGMCALIFALVPVLNLLAPLLFLAWFDQANFAKNRIEAIQDYARA